MVLLYRDPRGENVFSSTTRDGNPQLPTADSASRFKWNACNVTIKTNDGVADSGDGVADLGDSAESYVRS